ncbi:tetratricopeptide repeat protein [Thermosulfurimonas sp. F29]|uniref:tetratricopeptide repeat protein n=1 Tax=Thermosulfurimonas sp. F29 TaxID=2867247 RepID=UPI001C837BB1|nr:tetratricopeptide repeat protein [Thermosulfurimonas sp. F29]MBX6422804.1 tetratricopeptide repeat protein [Thermosulfurimonas sp. F29]
MGPQELFEEGAFLLMKQRFEEAIEYLSRAIEADPGMVKAYHARAAAYLKLERLDEAEADLRKALSLEPENPRLYFRLGQIFYRRSQLTENEADKKALLEKALEQFNRAIDIEPLYAAAFMARSQVYRDMGEEELADFDLDKAAAVQRETAKARKIIDF